MRLMILTDPLVGPSKLSAYSKVGWNLYKGLHEKHQIAHTPMLKTNKLGIFFAPPIGPLIYPSGDTDFCEDNIEKNCFHFNSDALLTIKDIVAFNELHQMSLEWIPYVPVDHAPIVPGIPMRLRTAFKVVAMSEFGRKELKRVGIDSTYIPHGFDPEVYKPLEGKDTFRGKFHIKPGEKVIGCIFMNQLRKSPDRILMVAKRLYEKYPDLKKTVRWFFWTDVRKDIPLIPIMINLGLTEYIYWPHEEMYNTGLTESLMNEFYNSFDTVFGCGAEGFWLPGVESQAAGIPAVHADYAAASELIDPKLRVKVSDWTYNNVMGARQPLVDIDDAVEKLVEVLQGSPEEYKARAVDFAKDFTWPKIIEEKWTPFLEECETELLPMLTKDGVKKWDQTIE